MALNQNDLQKIGQIVNTSINTALIPVKKDLKTIKRTTNKIRKDLELAVGELDKDRDTLEKRVKNIEDTLGVKPDLTN